MTSQERNAAVFGAGAGAFCIAVAEHLLGAWGFWPLVIVFVVAGGVALADNPDED